MLKENNKKNQCVSTTQQYDCSIFIYNGCLLGSPTMNPVFSIRMLGKTVIVSHSRRHVFLHILCNITWGIYTVIHKYILLIKTEMHYFSNLFWYRTLHVSDRSTVQHQESSTVYTAVSITCMKTTYCCVYRTRLLMMESRPVRNM